MKNNSEILSAINKQVIGKSWLPLPKSDEELRSLVEKSLSGICVGLPITWEVVTEPECPGQLFLTPHVHDWDKIPDWLVSYLAENGINRPSSVIHFSATILQD